MSRRRIIVACVVAGFSAGCAFTPPYVGQGPHLQVRRGHAIPFLDVPAEILALPGKLILWNGAFCNHRISQATEAKLISYLNAKTLPAFEQTTYRLNEYAPFQDLGALMRNKQVAWPYRLLLGLPITVVYDIVLTGRLFPWGDYYNPYTNVVHLYSDDAAVALHEAGHAYDFADYPLKGTYALLRILPFLDLYQEWMASENAVAYLVEQQDREGEFHAYRTLWPAYGTYGGAYLPLPLGSIAGAGVGHIAGRFKVKERREYYKRMDAVLGAPEEGLRRLQSSQQPATK